MKVLAIAGINVRRMLRERSNIFFVFIFPLGLILLIGAQFGGDFQPAVGLHLADQGHLATAIATEVEAEALDIQHFESPDDLVAAVERGGLAAGVLLPEGLDQTAAGGGQAQIGYLSRPDGAGQQIQAVVFAAVDRVMMPVAAARFAVEKTGVSFEGALELASNGELEAPGLEVETTTVGEALFPASMGRFDLGASSQLVLFVFLTAVAGSASLIQSRRLGLSRRMLATPTSVRTVVLGEASGRWAVAMVQGLYIVVVTLLAFRVNWGDPLGAVLLLVAFSAVGAAAGMLLGSVFENDNQAGGIGIVLSLGLAALGGAMLPIELFSETMQRVARVTPHAWALSGFAELTRRDGAVADILPELGVLAGYATLLFVVASWRLRAVITRP